HRRRPSVRVARTHERDQAVRYMVVNSTNTVQAPVYARVAALTGTRRSSAAWSTTVPLSLRPAAAGTSMTRATATPRRSPDAAHDRSNKSRDHLSRFRRMSGVLNGLTHPIVLAPLAGGPATPALAAAVCEAGRLGFLAAGYRRADDVRAEVRDFRGRTALPFGLNLFVPGDPAELAVPAALTQKWPAL